ncbi:MAG: hydantoinase B/oxoprolinase family protein [Acidimicrobiales bacterium]
MSGHHDPSLGIPDPITFEIVRHRLSSINEEAAASIVRISGSTVVTEATDMNTGLLLADGTVVIFGLFVLVHSLSLNTMVRDVIENYWENPGIGPGDMFISNDPFVTGTHQLDSTIVAPIFDGDELVAWSATIVHQSDVGGPTPGSYNVAARTVFEEALPMVPMKIVEAGTIRNDVRREWLVRTRTPELNHLDLVGQIAANRLYGERVLDLCSTYGTEAVTGTLNRLVTGTEAALRRRLEELPDGTWRYTGYNDHDGVDDIVNPVRLTMVKKGDSLLLDFTDVPPQSRAMVNMTGIKSFVGAALMTVLGFDGLPWVPGAFEKVIEIRTTPGTILNATWPAATNGGATFSGQEARTATNICLSRMFDASEKYASFAIASCQCSAPGQIASGTHADGRYFTVTMLDAQGGGSGASPSKDGCEVSGPIHSPGGACANIEANEYSHGIRYLWRRERPDSGGPGQHRGGVGSTFAYVPHRTSSPVEVTLFCHAVRQPASSGVLGGEPGSQHAYVIVRDAHESALRDMEESSLFKTGEIPAPKSMAELKNGDALLTWVSGGGGFGDPLERPSSDVLEDVWAGLVTADAAARDYGVRIITSTKGVAQVEENATLRLREEIRRDRLGGRDPLPEAEFVDGRWLSSALVISDERDGDPITSCRRCGTELGSARVNLKTLLVMEERPVARRWALAARNPDHKNFVVRHFFCPGCARQLDVEVARRSDPLIWSVQLDL